MHLGSPFVRTIFHHSDYEHITALFPIQTPSFFPLVPKKKLKSVFVLYNLTIVR